MSYGFFINRPVLSCVISILIVFIGLLCLKQLPIAQYPKMTPPSISVSASYSGASAMAVAQTVAQPIEQQLNSLPDLLYMRSSCSAQGSMSISLTFASNIDIDKTVVEVNNRIQSVLHNLPTEVQRAGVRVVKRSSDILGIVSLYCAKQKYDKTYMANYAALNITDELKRLGGVGDAQIMGGANYAMRIWLYPDRLAQYKLTASDVLAAVREQNAQYSVGHFGEAPDDKMGAYSYSASAQGRMSSVEEFGNIILRSDSKGAMLRLKDVARIELGSEQYLVNTKLNGQDAVPIMINLQTGGNALEAMNNVKSKMQELAKNFPPSMEYKIAYDTTDFIKVSISEVFHTFVEALILVLLVVYIFLQNWRASLIPLIAVPISIIGSFIGLYLLGFSLNLLSLFGLVLAIGIVVDDAIIVLENIERLMRTENLTVKEAAVKSMSEVMVPVIAIVLVLCAVFIPVCFLGGMAGIMYKQFAATIAIAVITSGVVALTLTPVLCIMLLQSSHQENRFFRKFNILFDKLIELYTRLVAQILKYSKIALLGFLVIIIAIIGFYKILPHSLVPKEDQGSLMGFVVLPPASSLVRTLDLMNKVQKMYNSHDAVENVVSISGLDLFSGGLKSSAGAFFISLKDWALRQKKPNQDADSLSSYFMRASQKFEEGMVMSVNPPPIAGLSTTGGVSAYLQLRGKGNVSDLAQAAENLMNELRKSDVIANIRTTFMANVPQYSIIVDKEKAIAMGVPISSIYQTMSASLGSIYVNDFSLYGKNYKVELQSDAEFRRSANDLSKIFVRSNKGSMIPLDVLVHFKRIVSFDQISRYNGFYAIMLIAQPKAGYATGDVINLMEQKSQEMLGSDYQLAWTGSAYEELQASNSSSIALIAGIIMVFLILAAQYENWVIPIVVILALPFAILGAFLFSWARGLANDVYFQIGLVTLIGLAAKNAILIVEFALQEYKKGKNVIDAALTAANLRFRPIIMTSVVFILGTLPLAISTGAGAQSRHSIATGVIGGMVFATVILPLYVPLFFKLIINLIRKN